VLARQKAGRVIVRVTRIAVACKRLRERAAARQTTLARSDSLHTVCSDLSQHGAEDEDGAAAVAALVAKGRAGSEGLVAVRVLLRDSSAHLPSEFSV
jgi:hypothetical protein